MKKLFKVLGIIASVIAVLIIIGIVYFNLKYPDVNPPSKIKVKATSEKIERGKYLANHVAMCIDCHSTRDWTKFSGPVIPGTEGKGGENFGPALGLPGNIYVKNITPAGIGNWSDGEIIRAITQGVNKDNKALFPIMPYNSFNRMTQEDIESLVAYIRTLKPIENKVPETDLDFPMNIIVKTIPLKSYIPSKPVNMNDSVSYGKYLVAIASCGDCHTPAEKGEPVAGMMFGGGAEFKTPWGLVRSANITPDNETGIGTWDKASFIHAFKQYASEKGQNIQVDSNSFNSIMPWTLYAGMTEEDISCIYNYLRTVKPVKHRVIKYTPSTKD
jgi:mono/diheme cytochrome c family protein